MVFDFAGTDPQAKVGINPPYHATVGACFEAVLSTFGYDLPKNQGLFGVMEVRAPEGSVVNVADSGPVSLNTTSGGAVTRYLANSVMAQMAARSEKWRAEVVGQSMGNRMARHAGLSQHGFYYVSTLVGLGGGGARSYTDGIDSSGMETGGTSSCHNVEWVEVNFPLLHIRLITRDSCELSHSDMPLNGVVSFRWQRAKLDPTFFDHSPYSRSCSCPNRKPVRW